MYYQSLIYLLLFKRLALPTGSFFYFHCYGSPQFLNVVDDIGYSGQFDSCLRLLYIFCFREHNCLQRPVDAFY